MFTSNFSAWFEPTDLTVATKPFKIERSKVDYCSPNFKELQRIAEYLTGATYRDITLDNDLNAVLKEARDLALRVLPTVPNIMVTLGKHGLLVSILKWDNSLIVICTFNYRVIFFFGCVGGMSALARKIMYIKNK